MQSKKTNKLAISQNQFIALQRGSQDALREVYEVFYDLVWFSAMKLGASEEEADELTQEVFIALYEHASSIRSKDVIGAWMISTLRNRFLDLRRVDRRSGEFQDVAEASYRQLDRVASYEFEVEIVGKELLDFCKESSHADLKLFYVEGYSVKKIAGIHGESLSAVTTRLTRLRRKFREILEQKYREFFN